MPTIKMGEIKVELSVDELVELMKKSSPSEIKRFVEKVGEPQKPVEIKEPVETETVAQPPY